MTNAVKPNASARQFATVSELAAATGKTPATIRAWIANGSLPSVRLGRSILVPNAVLQALLNVRLPSGGFR